MEADRSFIDVVRGRLADEDRLEREETGLAFTIPGEK